MDNNKTTMTPIDSKFFESLGDAFASTAEKDFFEKMKYRAMMISRRAIRTREYLLMAFPRFKSPLEKPLISEPS